MITRRLALGGMAVSVAGLTLNTQLRADDSQRSNLIFLTSDDGPGAGTATIIDIAERNEVPIALFMIGMNATLNEEHRGLFQRARNSSWITVGNHSGSHCSSHYIQCYHDTKSIVSDFQSASRDLDLVSSPTFARGPAAGA